jgi:hypothetical protein
VCQSATLIRRFFSIYQMVWNASFKGSDQWEGRGCRRSPNHYMIVGKVVLDVFFVILMGCHLVWTVIYCSASKAKYLIVFAANNSRCCKCLVAPTIIWSGIVGRFFATQNHKKMRENILLLTLEALTSRCYQHWQHRLFGANYSMSYSRNSMCWHVFSTY